MEPEKQYQRYQRQILLKAFGEEAQEKLLSSKVLVIGAGGLGCPALQYLAAAGVGQIGIVDFDVVELSNLQRQILFTPEDIGKGKAEIATKKIKALNPEIKVEAFHEKISNVNAIEIISRYDIVLDGSDNFTTRYLVNDACVLMDKPLVYGAVLKFEGQVGVFNFEDKSTGSKLNYRDLFPVPPGEVLSCNEVGVLGVLPGIIGVMQAAEVIKVITGVGEPLSNKILTFNSLHNSFYTIEVSENKHKGIHVPQNKKEFQEFNYETFCGLHEMLLEITPQMFVEMLDSEKVLLVDVREMEEVSELAGEGYVRMPLSGFENKIGTLPVNQKIVLICKTGKRSLNALQLLKKRLPEYEAYSLKGGLDALKSRVKR